MKMTRAEVRLSELAKVEGSVIDLEALKKAGVIPMFAEQAKLILSGEISESGHAEGRGRPPRVRARPSRLRAASYEVNGDSKAEEA